MKKVILTYALEEELPQVEFPDSETIYVCTGVGKIYATMRLMDALYGSKVDAVINVGTAGTTIHCVGDVLVCRTFIDRDYETLKLPGIKYTTETSELLTERRVCVDWRSQTPSEPLSFLDGICNTGDNFVTEAESINGDAIDMEAYAQAIVCSEKKIPFLSVKYVTDIIGQNSVKVWADKLADARNTLSQFLNGRKIFVN